MKHHILLLLVVTACKSSSASPDAVACETGAPELAKQLALANGLNMDLTKPDVQKQIESAKAAVTGKRYAFTGCRFKGQGNDMVWFSGNESGDGIECVMKGGEAGNKEFRHAAMAFDLDKLRLDVSGTIKLGDGQFPRLQLADCAITPHE